ELPPRLDSHIRRDLSPNLVAKAQSDLPLRKTRCDASLGVILREPAHLDARLQYQTIGDQERVLGLQACSCLSRLGEVGRGLHIEAVRRGALHPDGGPCSRWSRVGVLPDSGHE